MFSLAVCLGLVAPLPSCAAGRVYSREELAVCRALAQVHGVYAVYSRHDDVERTRTYEIVVAPGTKVLPFAAKARDILAALPGKPRIVEVIAEVYAFHDPTKTEDFRRTFSASEFMTSIYGFPDYRGPLAAEARGAYNPVNGASAGAWTVRSVYSDPARFSTGS